MKEQLATAAILDRIMQKIGCWDSYESLRLLSLLLERVPTNTVSCLASHHIHPHHPQGPMKFAPLRRRPHRDLRPPNHETR